MREIKFRAWTGTKMEYNVLVGNLGAFYVEGLDKNDAACISPFNTIYSKDTTIMQYTGIKDKNGNEIYEGDILQRFNREITQSAEVYFENGNYRVKGNFCVGGFDCLWWMGESAKVVGNIYENPELI